MARQSMVSDGTDVSRSSSIAASAGLGVLAAAIGYLATYLVIADEVRENLGSVDTWQGVAWYFYNAHLVDIEMSGAAGGFAGSSTIDFIAQSSATSADLLYAVPPIVLLGIGALLAYQFDAADIEDAVTVGAPVTIGYAVVLGIGTVVTESSSEGSFFGAELSATMGPALVPAILLGGVLYPLVFATTGAVLATVFGDR